MRVLATGLVFAIASLCMVPPALARGPAYIAIIIDDMGNNLRRGERAIRLPGSLTYSVLPLTQFSRQLAVRAHRAGKQVMVHVPMANVSGAPLGPGALTDDLSRTQFVRILDNGIASVPFAQGINNHMGSELTQRAMPMRWLMDDIRHRNFFFVDSRTTPRTVALSVARQKNIISSRRDIFLDNVQSIAAIDTAFQHLLRLARHRGTAIAIAHPHDVTLSYLEHALPRLAGENIRIVPVSRLIELQQPSNVQYARKQ